MRLLLVFSQLELAYLSNVDVLNKWLNQLLLQRLVLQFSAQKILCGSPALVDFRGVQLNFKAFVPNGEGCRRVILLLNIIYDNQAMAAGNQNARAG